MSATYIIQISTGTYAGAQTKDWISVTLVGTLSSSDQIWLDNWGLDFYNNAYSQYTVICEKDLGEIMLVRFVKQPMFFVQDSWYCNFVKVIGPNNKVYKFPVYQWIETSDPIEIREGKGLLVTDDVMRECRVAELDRKCMIYKWRDYFPGMPRCLDVGFIPELERSSRFSFTKNALFYSRAAVVAMEQRLRGYSANRDSWKSFDAIMQSFRFNRTDATDYIIEHWQEDEFFGYQFLNGLNPSLIRRCTSVAPDMADVAGVNDTSCLFVADYGILDGIPPGTNNKKMQHIAAPVCLLRLTKQGTLVPVAIRIGQTPGPLAPVFSPTDSEWDWLMAKTWVRNAHFYVHQVVAHLLQTHLLAEVFAMATFRNLPACHPVYKLLAQHTRFTFNINALAREILISRGGYFDESSGLGFDGLHQLCARGLTQLTYTSMCLPDDLLERGVMDVPNYYYRDDGLKIWGAIHSFVTGIVEYYYSTDSSVRDDSEIQAWVKDIFVEGFLSRANSGMPQRLESRSQLQKFLTMIIFTVTARHAAVNNGQYANGAWMPHFPSSMRSPPPHTKGQTTLQSYLDTLPPINITCQTTGVLYLLSAPTGHAVALGEYPYELFTETKPQQYIRLFQDTLNHISKEIMHRNSTLPLPYQYLNPPLIESSVSI